MSYTYSSSDDDEPLVFRRSSKADKEKCSSQPPKPSPKPKNDSDSEDDKPLSCKISVVSKGKTNHAKPQVENEDSDDEKPFSSKFVSKPNVRSSSLTKKVHQNGSAYNNRPRNIGLNKKPPDDERSSGQSPVKGNSRFPIHPPAVFDCQAMRRRRQQSPEPRVNPCHLPRLVDPEPDPDQPPPIEHPGDAELHAFLRFDREEDRTNRDYLQGKADRHGYQPLRYIAWESLATVSVQGRAETLCGPHWRRLFSIKRMVAQELALEFFSTLHLVTPLVDYEREDALTFRLAGAERQLSLRQFAVHMGLYTLAELDTPAFIDAISDWPEGITPSSFWPKIGRGEYTSPTVPKSMKLRDPLHRVLHRAIVHSLTTHGESPGSITDTDLFYLYCMVHNRPCQLALCLAKFLVSIRTSRLRQGIYGGGYVTHLAVAMDLLPRAVADNLTFSAPSVPINMNVLCRMKVAGMVGRHMHLLDHEGRPWVPPRPEGEVGAGGVGGGDHGHAEPEIHHEGRDSPPKQQPQQQPGPIVYSREASLDVIERSISEFREIQRMEFEHAEAHRQYMTSMMQILVADALSKATLPEPPVPSQRLRDFYAGAGSSHMPRQPPPP